MHMHERFGSDFDVIEHELWKRWLATQYEIMDGYRLRRSRRNKTGYANVTTLGRTGRFATIYLDLYDTAKKAAVAGAKYLAA